MVGGLIGIQLAFVPGEAAWQVGKRSRHLETLKETMSLICLEKGALCDPQEALQLALSAKNGLRQIRGLGPNQWAFGMDKSAIESWLQEGHNLANQSLPQENTTFEEDLKLVQLAKESFIKADSQRRILRAARGQARKSEIFEIGKLVYFYRKGRNASSQRICGWYGPARIIGVEKTGSEDLNQTQGSIIWIVYGVILYRGAPEQLRKLKVTSHLQDMSEQLPKRSIFEEIADEPVDSDLREEAPPSSAQPPAQETALLRARLKQPERHVDQDKKVTQSLSQRQKIQEAEQKESETQTEKDRCQALPLSKLADEILMDGQRKGKSCREIYQGLFGHRRDNTKFFKVMIYARRVEECQEKTGQLTKTLVKSSGEMPISKQPRQSGTHSPLRAKPSTPPKSKTRFPF